MKTILTILLAVMMIMPAMTSCSSSKKLATVDDEIEIKQSRCEKLAYEKPALRSWGEGTYSDQSTAYRMAQTNARNTFASNIEAMVENATDIESVAYRKFSSNGQESATANDQGGKVNDLARSISSQLLRGVVVIDSETRKTKDNQFHVYCCVEYQGSISELAAKMKDAAQSTIGQQVSDEERAKINVELEDFRKRIEEQLQHLRGNK